jgi:1,4-alpha-glucan branching enzyme
MLETAAAPDQSSTASLLTDYDLHLFNEGTHTHLYTKMGAHPTNRHGVLGTLFAVWAPNAEAVSVVGDFNSWQPGSTWLQCRGTSGIWEGFAPGIGQGTLYKYAVQPRHGGHWLEKSDPYAFASELRPKTASVVWDMSTFRWHDDAWLAERMQRQALDAPMSIYEVHLGSWKRVPENNDFLNYRDLAQQLAEYCAQLGYTHVELMPVAEHPLDQSWGYQTIGYFAPTSRFGSPDDFKSFVDTLHQAGIGVLMDWVPGHFPWDPHGLATFDGTACYEHADARQAWHPHWGTKVFNYGRHEVRSFLLSNALFWLEEYHLDGLRVDAVASMLYLDYGRRDGEWVANQFGGRENVEAIDLLRRINEVVHTTYPGVLTIAEESTAWPMVSRPPYMGGLGFSLKWNMGWMNDTLGYIAEEPVHRRWHHNELSFSLLYAFHENFVLPLSHDEVVHGKGSLLGRMSGDPWQQFATLRLLLGYMWGHPGKKLLFMGNDFGQGDEWSESKSIDWHLLQYPFQSGVQRWVTDLNRLYRSEPALHEVDFDWPGFEWLEVHDAHSSVFAFLRRARNQHECVAVLCNFTPVPRHNYRVGVPVGGPWSELLNSDAATYGGSNMGNGGQAWASDEPWAGQPYSMQAMLPPLGVLFLKPG